MHSLFWKIFLSFWVFMILFGLSSVFITVQLDHLPKRHSNPSPRIMMRLQRIVQFGANRERLADFLERYQQRTSFEDAIYVLDSDGKDLLNRPLPTRLQQAVTHSAAKSIDTFPLPPRERPSVFGILNQKPDVLVRSISLLSGQSFKIIIDHQERQAHWRKLRSLGIGARIAIASILSGLVCFFLARYLTIPLKKLRSATHQIALGDFENPNYASILERKDEIGDLGRDFDSMSKQIETALFSQQRLLRDVSHELRSPLTRLQIALGLARQRSNSLVEPELDRIELEVERLNDLVGQTLSLARLSNQTSLLADTTPINLTELLECVTANAEYEAQQKQCSVSLSAEGDCIIEGNRDLLYSGLENILRNAVHYTKPGSTVEIKSTLLTVGNNPIVCITIRDYGPGVPQAEIENLFKPFFRVDDARSPQNKGYGIGLAIAERAIHLHKGKVGIVNASGGGLEIAIQLPIDNAVSPEF